MENGIKLVKLGLVGCGNVAEYRHLPALRSIKNAEVVAVADINADRLERVADKFHVENRYADYRALVSDPGVEAVAICTTTQLHVEIALAALDAEKHVLLEKPLALSLDEADRLIERAAQSRRKVMVGFNLRWHRLVRQAREMIQHGKLGTIELVLSAFASEARYRQNVSEWKKRRELGGGVLVENAVHYFDLWRFLLQDEVEEIFAMSRSEQWDDVTASITARMANGLLVTAVLCGSTGARNELQIYGQAGYLHLSLYCFDGLKFASLWSLPGNIRTRMQNIVHFLKEFPQAIPNIRQGGDFNASYRAQWRHFIDSIQQDTALECTLEDGRRALQIVLAAVQSASAGQPVRVAQSPSRITSLRSDTPGVGQREAGRAQLG
jgi:myo-inositol 2-dehydrogenase/D-chiro-inositol 1-dehydrogenase